MRREVARRAGAIVVMAVAVASCGSSPDPEPPPPPSPTWTTSPRKEAANPPGTAVVPPEEGAWLGLFVEPQRADQSGTIAANQAQEDRIGRPLDIVQWFYPWDRPFPTWREPWAAAGGRRNLVTWGRFDAAAVRDGRADAAIDARARGLAALGHPVLLRWSGEMDSLGIKDIAVSPSVFVAAWRHIHDRFRAQGATNVDLVWCPTAEGFATGRAQAFYPGDDYVDWICSDGYSWAPKQRGARWRSFEQVFAAFYEWAAPRRKPIIIGETGALEDPAHPERKADWIRGMADTLENRMTAVKAVVWFDASHPPRFAPTDEYDFRLATSPAAAAAWTDIAHRDWFNP